MLRKKLSLLLGVLSAVVLLHRSAFAQETIYGMTAASSSSLAAGVSLVSFSNTTPGTINTIGAFTGVTAGQSLRTIDFRPATGQLYALSSNATAAQLYTVNLATAALSPVGAGITLTGNATTRLNMSFNPSNDTISLLGGGAVGVANNYTISPTTGAITATNTNLAYASGDVNAAATPSIIGAAYSNRGGGGAPTLYAWDFNNDALVTVGGPGGVPSPATGTLTTVNDPPVFLTTNGGLGMSISGATNTLFVSHDDPANAAVMSLYTRDLSTGAETLIGAYPAGTFVADISVAPVPEPGTILLCGCVALGLARFGARRLAARA